MLETGDVASMARDVWRLETGDVAAIYRLLLSLEAYLHFNVSSWIVDIPLTTLFWYVDIPLSTSTLHFDIPASSTLQNSLPRVHIRYFKK